MKKYIQVILVSLFITSCNTSYISEGEEDIIILPEITSCSDIVQNIEYFQQDCKQDSDCIGTRDANTFCFSEVVSKKHQAEYENFFAVHNCPTRKQIDCTESEDIDCEWNNYCKIDWKSGHYCDLITNKCDYEMNR